MSSVTREQLLEAGVQFGHQTKRWDPKMRKYIFNQRNGIHIIDLQKTMRKLDEAYRFVKETTENNGKVLFVGTKKQAKEAVKTIANSCNSPYVTERWLGGTLTNFKTIKSSIKKLIDIENKEKSGEVKLLTKKEQILLFKEKARLERNLGGIRNMYKIPEIIFITDTITNKTALEEAKKLGIKIVAICDSNSNPDGIDYIIPGNDDATKAITLITSKIAAAILEGQGITKMTADESDKPPLTVSEESTVSETPVTTEVEKTENK